MKDSSWEKDGNGQNRIAFTGSLDSLHLDHSRNMADIQVTETNIAIERIEEAYAALFEQGVDRGNALALLSATVKEIGNNDIRSKIARRVATARRQAEAPQRNACKDFIKSTELPVEETPKKKRSHTKKRVSLAIAARSSSVLPAFPDTSAPLDA